MSLFLFISTMFWPICPAAFFRCLSNSGTFTELRTTSFIESTRVTYSIFISIYGGPYMEGKGKPSDKVEIIDRAEHWRIRRLKESAHMLGYNDLLSGPSIELNTIWEPIIKKARWKKKKKNLSTGKKSYMIVVILVK